MDLGQKIQKIIVNQLITNERNDQDYFKFFPTINISYKFNKSESILIGFNRRISRPRARFLNPFLQRSWYCKFFSRKSKLNT